MGVPVWAGRVVVVAGYGGVLNAVAGLLVAEDALVAMVTTDAGGPEVAARFRADPTDPQVWDRVIPHVEQRLGPIDAAIIDASVRAIADQLLAPDLVRRGHGAIVTVEGDSSPEDLLRKLADTL